MKKTIDQRVAHIKDTITNKRKTSRAFDSCLEQGSLDNDIVATRLIKHALKYNKEKHMKLLDTIRSGFYTIAEHKSFLTMNKHMRFVMNFPSYLDVSACIESYERTEGHKVDYPA